MEAKTSKKIALWMDQSHAILVGYEQNEARILEELTSPIESHTREDGEGSDLTRFGANPGDASNNEHTKHNVLSNQIKAYFLQLEKKLMDKDELLLLGPGVTKTQFSNHLKESKHHNELHITVENADKMSPNQLIALVQEKFASPSKDRHGEGKHQANQGMHTGTTHDRDRPAWGDQHQDKQGKTADSERDPNPTWADKNQPKQGAFSGASPQKGNETWDEKNKEKQELTTSATSQKGHVTGEDKSQSKQSGASAVTPSKDKPAWQDQAQQKKGASPAGTSSKDQPWTDKSQDKKGDTAKGIPQKPPMAAPRMTSEQEEE